MILQMTDDDTFSDDNSWIVKPTSFRKLAEEEMARRSALLTAYSFSDESVQIICEDGSVFFIRNSFFEEWGEADRIGEWLFVYCEHYPDMCFDTDDLIYWGSSK